MRVPEKIVELLNNIPPTVTGFLMAVMIGVLRVIFNREESRPVRVLMEGLICGFLTLAAGSITGAIGVVGDWNLFLGGFIGLIGSHKIRMFAIKTLDRKADPGKTKD